MSYILENFIDFCDDYIITCESESGQAKYDEIARTDYFQNEDATKASMFAKIKLKLCRLFSSLIMKIDARVKKMKDGTLKNFLCRVIKDAKKRLYLSKSLQTYDRELVATLREDAETIVYTEEESRKITEEWEKYNASKKGPDVINNINKNIPTRRNTGKVEHVSVDTQGRQLTSEDLKTKYQIVDSRTNKVIQSFDTDEEMSKAQVQRLIDTYNVRMTRRGG